MIFNPENHQLAPLPHGPLPEERELAELAHRRHMRQEEACRKALHDMLHRHDNELDEIDAHLREDIGRAPGHGWR